MSGLGAEIAEGARVEVGFAGGSTVAGVVGARGDGWLRVDVEGAQRGPDGAVETVARPHFVNLAQVAWVRVG